MTLAGTVGLPSLDLEHQLARASGITYIAGVDEAGRGALAGPVYAAAVILPLDNHSLMRTLADVNDSKLLSHQQREELYPVICAQAVAFGVGHSSARFVDEQGIIAATRHAMQDALAQLHPAAQSALVDGTIRLSIGSLPQQQVIRGDRLSLSIAAASILAKVSRDRHMMGLELGFPGYGFARHKGYGTVAHLAAIQELGPCGEHRLSFSPFAERDSRAGESDEEG